jgi:hypothetical protein
MNKKAIFVFTCNNSEKLKCIASEIFSCRYSYFIHIIDDSHKNQIIEENYRISTQNNSMIYLGKKEFIDFYKLKKDSLASKIYLGAQRWNLGVARNFALDYSLQNQYNKVLFIDDDISEIDSEKISKGFSTLKDNNFVSCRIAGLEDDSIIGHIAKKVGVIDKDPRMLSGGFLFLSPTSLKHSFFNIYNEDWIIQLLEDDKEKITLPFSVKHNSIIADFSIRKILFQEIGEIIVEGLIVCPNALSMDSDFWGDVIKKRIKFIQLIKNKAQEAREKKYFEICCEIESWLNQFDGTSLLNTIKQDSDERIKNQL